MSREREILEQISNGNRTWKPADITTESYERFQADLPDLTDALDWLVCEGYIEGYDPRTLNPIQASAILTAFSSPTG